MIDATAPGINEIMNLLVPRLILMHARPAASGKLANVWVHFAQGRRGIRMPVQAWIAQARQEEWGQLTRSHPATIESVRGRASAKSPIPGKSWTLFVDELLRMPVNEVAGEPELGEVKELAPLLKLAREIVRRPTVIGLVNLGSTNDRTEAHSLVAEIAAELRTSPHLLEGNSVAFLRVSDGVKGDRTSIGADHLFEELVRELMAQLTSIDSDDHPPKEGPRLLIGETGSGKTELARALHNQLRSATGRGGAFHAVNIAAVNPSLLEARLRGYNKGAYTGAEKDQEGWFEIADEGTLFLDELQAAPMDFQVQLLDLLSPVSDAVEVARIGGKDQSKRRCRVRVVMATNESEESLLEQRKLRRDLAYRIRARIKLPTLAERLRRDDGLLPRLLRLNRWRSVPALVFRDGKLTKDGQGLETQLNSCLLPILGAQALEALRAHDWPGNLRELERVCFDAFLEHDRTGATDWPEIFAAAIGVAGQEHSVAVQTESVSRAQVARQIERHLIEHDFNVSAVQYLLAPYQKKSPPALRSFLRANREHLDMSRWTSPKARKLLGEPT